MGDGQPRIDGLATDGRVFAESAADGRVFAEGSRPRGGPMLAEVTKAMVRLHSDYYGRGATKARTEWVGEDMLICVLRDCFTRVERTLIELGEHRSVRETRQVFQDAMRDRFTEAVSEIVGRPVTGFLSQISPEPECVVEIFMFDSAPDAAAENGNLHTRTWNGRG